MFGGVFLLPEINKTICAVEILIVKNGFFLNFLIP
jgi:ribosomal protein L9